jgi:hypothetical protein
MLLILDPQHVITAGRDARSVIDEALRSSGLKTQVTTSQWLHPSPRNGKLNAWIKSTGATETELLVEYPQVREVRDRHPQWGGRRNIYYACYAVAKVQQETAKALPSQRS